MAAWLLVGLVVGFVAGWWGRGAFRRGRKHGVRDSVPAPAAPVPIETADAPAEPGAPAVAGGAQQLDLTAGLEPPEVPAAATGVSGDAGAATSAADAELEEKSRRLVEELERRFAGQQGQPPKRPKD